MSKNTNNTQIKSSKTKMSAVFIAIFLGLFVWLYTAKKSTSKFIVAFFTVLGVFIIYYYTLEFELIFLSTLFLFILIATIFGTWLWALIDTAIKPESFFENYPK